MKIQQIVWQNRRDFQALFECEGCGDVVKQQGYDCRNFHDNVTPAMKCTKCGKSRNDMGIVGEYTELRYAEDVRGVKMSPDNEFVTCVFCHLKSLWGGRDGDPIMWCCEECGEIFCGDCCIVDNENDERILCGLCR